MLYRKAVAFLLIILTRVMETLQTIDIQNSKVFEIVLDDMNYNENNENEMIQPMDLEEIKSFAEDKDKYKALHFHVKRHNERKTENKKKEFWNILPYWRSHTEEIFNSKREDKPFIVGFKDELDEYFGENAIQTTTDYKTSIETVNYANFNKNKRDVQNFRKLHYKKNEDIKDVRKKREIMDNHYETTEASDFFQTIRHKNVTMDIIDTMETRYSGETQVTQTQYDVYNYDRKAIDEDIEKDSPIQLSITDRSTTLSDIENSDEESYDHEKFKMEYEQQLKYNIEHGKTFNYTEKEESEKMSRVALRKIIDLKRPKNCTKEELKQIGIKAIECLVHDYQRAEDIATVKTVLWRTWLVLRVWLLIYICLAIPCWCYRGWCCCCFRCKFCFPQKRIVLAKQYYAMNPPGTFVRDSKKAKDDKEPIKYEATEYEYTAYRMFEAAIRNL